MGCQRDPETCSSHTSSTTHLELDLSFGDGRKLSLGTDDSIGQRVPFLELVRTLRVPIKDRSRALFGRSCQYSLLFSREFL
jgi:hypothetical protein